MISVHDETGDPVFFRMVKEALVGFPDDDLVIRITDEECERHPGEQACYVFPGLIIVRRLSMGRFIAGNDPVHLLRRVLLHEWAHHRGLGHHLIGETVNRAGN